ncbi:MAG: helix-turn-helix transcriptional regulator [Paramuribaculum sp.]|nr:helix-turn-helix transcriptional regulator [Paramuribaculum sp.]
MKALELQENLKKFTRTEDCPIRNVVARFSGKWSLLILSVLSVNETTRFNEIGKAIPDISPKVLSETLKKLESDRLIERRLYAEVPPRAEYRLTDLGRSLIPLLVELVGWAIDNYDEITGGGEMETMKGNRGV